MVKGICQVNQPMGKILSFKVFQEWFSFSYRKSETSALGSNKRFKTCPLESQRAPVW
jgi:hypothetical protein